MAGKALTTRLVETARPKYNADGVAVRTELPDGGSRGLRLVLFPTGRRSWIVRYRFKGRQRKLTLPWVTLAEARKTASEAMLEVARGVDPATKRAHAAALASEEASNRAGDTVDNLITKFTTMHTAKKRESTRIAYEHILNRVVLPAWRGRSVHEIKRRDVVALLDQVAEDRPVLANRTLAVTHKLFAWAVARSVLGHSPVTGVERPAEETARDRVLDDEEIRLLWQACGSLGNNKMAGVVRLLILTGQRRGEVIGMLRSEIVGDVWKLPGRRTKNGIEHAVPLSAQALAVIADAPGQGDALFAPIGGGRIADAKTLLDRAMNPRHPWVFHDIRRTVASGMARIGIMMPVVERVLNHRSGSFAGIVSVYQHYDFLVEKRDALQRWGEHVEAIVQKL